MLVFAEAGAPAEPYRATGHAILAFLPIILALILLPTIAFASPPDPSWIAGFYDGADGDDIVTLVYEGAAVHGAVVSGANPLPFVTRISLERSVPESRGGRVTHGPRSPPLLRSTVYVHISNFPLTTRRLHHLTTAMPLSLIVQHLMLVRAEGVNQ